MVDRGFMFELTDPKGKTTLWMNKTNAVFSIPERFRIKVLETPPGIFTYSSQYGSLVKYIIKPKKIEDSAL